LEELAAPALTLRSAGFDVDIASIAGGAPPLDEKSTVEPYTSEDTVAFLADAEFQEKVKNTKPVSEYVATASTYSCVFLPGGHGTVVDFKPSDDLKKVVEAVSAAGGVVSAVCHGQCGLITAKDSTGASILKGKKVTSFSNEEETQVGLFGKVFSLEDELKECGAEYVNGPAWGSHVIVDGKLVTGQNPASSKAVGEKLVEMLK